MKESEAQKIFSRSEKDEEGLMKIESQDFDDFISINNKTLCETKKATNKGQQKEEGSRRILSLFKRHQKSGC